MVSQKGLVLSEIGRWSNTRLVTKETGVLSSEWRHVNTVWVGVSGWVRVRVRVFIAARLTLQNKKSKKGE